MTPQPNTSRGCVKTPALNFGNDQILVMRNFVKMSKRIRWSENEFSHSLSLEPTPVGAVSSAFAVHVTRPAWLSSWSLGSRHAHGKILCHHSIWSRLICHRGNFLAACSGCLARFVTDYRHSCSYWICPDFYHGRFWLAWLFTFGHSIFSRNCLRVCWSVTRFSEAEEVVT